MPTPDRHFSPAPAARTPDAGPAAAYLPPPRLWRSRSNRVVAGVLGGLAEKFGWEPRPVRLLYGLFGVLTLPVAALPAIVPYLAVWSITRVLGAAPASGPRLWRSRTDVVVAGVLGGLAERMGVGPTLVRVAYAALTATTMMLPGVVAYLVLWARVRPGERPVVGPRWDEWRAGEVGWRADGR